MKHIISTILVFLSLASFAANGWREKEMEVKVTLNTLQEIQRLHQFHFNGDVYPNGTAILYLIPSELEKLGLAGFQYEILKEDLNRYYEHFWNGREEAYHTYQDIIDLADSLDQYFPGICQKTLYGYSLEGRQLAALKISDNVTVNESEAVAWFDGGIHGDEIGGSENVIRFARDLCLGYGTDPVITELVNSREIWLYLMVNPDGRENMVRYNANGVDLNRDWGYMWDGWGGSPDAYSQVETQTMRDVMLSLSASVSVSYHSGIELSLYPWGFRYSQANDDAQLSFIANLYSDVSGYDNLVAQQSVLLYPVNGGTTDMCYGVMGSASLTVELSTNKQPPVEQLLYYYTINYPSMIALIEQSGYGIEGIVTDAVTGDNVQALVYVNDYYPAYTDPENGDYHKFVLPGTYSVKIVANGYESKIIDNVVVYENGSALVNAALQPASGMYAYQVITVRIPGNNESDEGYTPGALGTPDEINYSLGKEGWIVLDMQETILDGPGYDLMVYEGDPGPEGFSCFASDDPDGPWMLVGEGTGTTGFDFMDGSVAQARYIKLVDDGDGSATGNNAGFDLDAVGVSEHISGTYLVVLDMELDDATQNGHLDPGETADLYVTIRNNGDIPAQGTSGTLTTGQLFVDIGLSSADYGVLDFGESSEGKFTVTVSDLTPNGFIAPFQLTVEANNGAYSNVFGFELMVGSIGEAWETGDFSSYNWIQGGNAPWLITEENAYEGNYCVRSGSIPNSASSEISVTLDVVADGPISFYRSVSSESGYDFLEFYINGILADRWSGEMEWAQVFYPVLAGARTFTWVYIKDVYVTSGSDRAWVDYIQFPPLANQALGTLSGMVTDQMTGLPIEGASISGVSLTGPDGSYSVDLQAGTFEICASREGYETLCLQATITNNQVTTLDFVLVPAIGFEELPVTGDPVRIFPSPSRGDVYIEFNNPVQALVRIEIYSQPGSLVKLLMNKVVPEGTVRMMWDGTDEQNSSVQEGVYFCRISFEGRIYTRKLIRL
jgi:succinylglutamate desuccinylase